MFKKPAKFVARKPHIPSLAVVARKMIHAARHLVFVNVQDFAYEEMQAFKTRIREQNFDSFDARPLSPSYLARKKALKLDLRTMIRTGHYLKSIKVFDVDYGKGRYRFFVGFGKDDMAVGVDGEETDLPLDLLAKIHEYGSELAHVPARPHWGPHLQDMHERAKALREYIKQQIMKAVK